MRCRGVERRLDECHPKRWGVERDRRYCSQYSRSAAVVCLPRSTTTSTTTTTTTTTTTPKPPTTTKTTTTTTTRPITQTPKPTTQTPKPTTQTPKPTTQTPKPTTKELSNSVNSIPNENIRSTNNPTIENIDEDNGRNEVIERYSNRSSVVFVDDDDDIVDDNREEDDQDDADLEKVDNVIQSVLESSNPRRSRLQYDAEWSESRRTREREAIPQTREPPTTTTKSTTRAPLDPNKHDDEVYAMDLPPRRWRKDPLLKCWVLLTIREEILIAKPGDRPKRISKEEYYQRRREEIMRQKGEEYIPNEVNRSPLNDASGRGRGNTAHNRIDTVRNPTTTTTVSV